MNEQYDHLSIIYTINQAEEPRQNIFPNLTITMYIKIPGLHFQNKTISS